MKKFVLLALFCMVGASTAWATTEIGVPGPFGNTVYVRGGFNGWGAVDAMTWDAANGQYDAVLTLAAGDWEFKIADDGWSNPDFGPTGDPAVTLGSPTDIGTAIGNNFMLSIVAPGQYLFRLSDIAQDLQSGTLVVRAIPLPAALLLFGSGLIGFGFFRRRS